MSTTEVAGLKLVERSEPHGRIRLSLVDEGADGVGVDACSLTIDPLELHDGSGGLVRVDGIGNVATLESHRRRGLATRLLEVAIERMRAGEAEASLLYGIDGFYVPLGWISCGDERWVRVEITSIDPAWADGFEVRAMRPADRAVIAGAYEQVAAATVGAASRRDGRAWAQLRESDVIVVELDGRLAGWAWRGAGDVAERDQVALREPDAIAFAELQALDAESMLALLAAVAGQVASEGDDARWLVTGACEGHVLRNVARVGWFASSIIDEVRPTGGAMLLPMGAAGDALLDVGALYQFLPDRF